MDDMIMQIKVYTRGGISVNQCRSIAYQLKSLGAKLYREAKEERQNEHN